MPPTVHILATCRSPELFPYTALVFNTLRVGFPSADVTVHLNRITGEEREKMVQLCADTNCKTLDADTIHHVWIESLVESAKEPFFTVDCDVVFYESFERFAFSGPLAGFRVPEFYDSFAGAITRARLHPSLLYLDPVKVKSALSKFREVSPETDFTPFQNPFYPTCLPLNGRMYFHDTVSLLYQAIGGESFTREHKEAYFHFHFGSIPDVVLPRIANGAEMAAARQFILEDPRRGRGMWRAQEEYFESRQPDLRTQPLKIEPISSEDAQKAIQWNTELCKGNSEAMSFNDLWYQYCHAIDDLLDTRVDGRPTMNQEQILALFAQAAVLYNHPFFVKNRTMLFPIALLITNQFADSVAWERSPIQHRRIMADALRTCGDEMYFAIAMICGGWEHTRTIGPKIRERDWIGQHDALGNSENMTYARRI